MATYPSADNIARFQATLAGRKAANKRQYKRSVGQVKRGHRSSRANKQVAAAAAKYNKENQGNEDLGGLLAGALEDLGKGALTALDLPRRGIMGAGMGVAGVGAEILGELGIKDYKTDFFGKAGDALKGEYHGADYLKDVGVKGEGAQRWGGLAVDFATDPIMYVAPEAALAKGAKGVSHAVETKLAKELVEAGGEIAVKASHAAPAAGKAARTFAVDSAGEAAQKGLGLTAEQRLFREGAQEFMTKIRQPGGLSNASKAEIAKYMDATGGMKLDIPFTGRWAKKAGLPWAQNGPGQVPFLPRAVTQVWMKPLSRGLAKVMRAPKMANMLEKFASLTDEGLDFKKAAQSGDVTKAPKGISGEIGESAARAAVSTRINKHLEDLIPILKRMEGRNDDVIAAVESGKMAGVDGAEELSGWLADMAKSAHEFNVPLNELPMYFPRQVREELVLHLKLNPTEQRRLIEGAEFAGKKLEGTPHEIRSTLNEWAKEKGYPEGYYEANPEKVLAGYMRAMEKKMVRGRTIAHMGQGGHVNYDGVNLPGYLPGALQGPWPTPLYGPREPLPPKPAKMPKRQLELPAGPDAPLALNAGGKQKELLDANPLHPNDQAVLKHAAESPRKNPKAATIAEARATSHTGVQDRLLLAHGDRWKIEGIHSADPTERAVAARATLNERSNAGRVASEAFVLKGKKWTLNPELFPGAENVVGVKAIGKHLDNLVANAGLRPYAGSVLDETAAVARDLKGAEKKIHDGLVKSKAWQEARGKDFFPGDKEQLDTATAALDDIEKKAFGDVPMENAQHGGTIPDEYRAPHEPGMGQEPMLKAERQGYADPYRARRSDLGSTVEAVGEGKYRVRGLEELSSQPIKGPDGAIVGWEGGVDLETLRGRLNRFVADSNAAEGRWVESGTSVDAHTQAMIDAIEGKKNVNAWTNLEARGETLKTATGEAKLTSDTWVQRTGRQINAENQARMEALLADKHVPSAAAEAVRGDRPTEGMRAFFDEFGEKANATRLGDNDILVASTERDLAQTVGGKPKKNAKVASGDIYEVKDPRPGSPLGTEQVVPNDSVFDPAVHTTQKLRELIRTEQVNLSGVGTGPKGPPLTDLEQSIDALSDKFLREFPSGKVSESARSTPSVTRFNKEYDRLLNKAEKADRATLQAQSIIDNETMIAGQKTFGEVRTSQVAPDPTAVERGGVSSGKVGMKGRKAASKDIVSNAERLGAPKESADPNLSATWTAEDAAESAARTDMARADLAQAKTDSLAVRQELFDKALKEGRITRGSAPGVRIEGSEAGHKYWRSQATEQDNAVRGMAEYLGERFGVPASEIVDIEKNYVLRASKAHPNATVVNLDEVPAVVGNDALDIATGGTGRATAPHPDVVRAQKRIGPWEAEAHTPSPNKNLNANQPPPPYAPNIRGETYGPPMPPKGVRGPVKPNVGPGNFAILDGDTGRVLSGPFGTIEEANGALDGIVAGQRRAVGTRYTLDTAYIKELHYDEWVNKTLDPWNVSELRPALESGPVRKALNAGSPQRAIMPPKKQAIPMPPGPQKALPVGGPQKAINAGKGLDEPTRTLRWLDGEEARALSQQPEALGRAADDMQKRVAASQEHLESLLATNASKPRLAAVGEGIKADKEATKLLQDAAVETDPAAAHAAVLEAQAKMAEGERARKPFRGVTYDKPFKGVTYDKTVPKEVNDYLFHAAIDDGLRKNLGAIGRPELSTHPDIVDIFTRVNKLKAPGGGTAFMKHYDQLLNYTKAWQIATPGFHVRNAMGGVFNNWIAGMDVGAYTRYRKAKGEWRALTKDGAEILPAGASKEATAYGEWYAHSSRGQYGRYEVKLGGAGQGRTPNPFKADNYLTHLSKNTGEWTEDYLRGSLAVDRLLKGQTIELALGDVYKFHFDYAALTSFEKQYVKRVVPFYTWTRKNFPLQLEMMAQQPGKYVRALKVRDAISAEQREIMPSWYKDAWASPLGLTTGSLGLGGDDQLFLTPDLPFTQTMTSPLPIGPNGVDLKRPLNMITPLLKVPAEMLAGQKAFANQKFDKDRVVGGSGPGFSGGLDNVPGLLPVLKALNIAKTAKDTDKYGRWKKGDTMLPERVAYGLESFIPWMSVMQRMAPAAPNKKDHALASVFGYLGIPVRANTKKDQALAKYFGGKNP